MNYELRSLIEALNENGIHVIADREFDKIAFDFSEHDKKVTEEKDKRIAELERITNEKMGKWDNSGIISAEILELEDENEELKRKLSEANNKINLNDRIKVKLTPIGAEIYYHQFDEINKKAGRTVIEPHMPRIDKDGYTDFALWEFIELYGKHIGVGKKNVIEPIDIFITQ